MDGRGYSDLQKDIIDQDLCMRCGACVASCPVDVLHYGGDSIELVGECISCGVCSRVCPGGGMDLSQIEKRLTGRSRRKPIGHRLGIYRRKTQLTSSKKEFIKAGYFGGRITAVLVSALGSGLIDAALLTDWNHDGHLSIGSAKVARTKEEIVSMASSKYVFSPVLTLLKEIEKDRDISKAALVGLPCNIQGFRKMQADAATSKLTEKVAYVIGLNCGAPQTDEGTWKDMIADLTGIPSDEISSIRYRKVSSRGLQLEVDRKHGERFVKEMEITKFLARVAKGPNWLRCRMCSDYSAELSDITFGAPVIRTERGEELIDNALDHGYLKSSSFKKSSIQDIQDIFVPLRKRRRARKNISERVSKGMGVPVYK